MTIFLMIAYLLFFPTVDIFFSQSRPTFWRGLVYFFLMIIAWIFCYASFRQWILPNPIEHLSEILHQS